MRNLNGKFIGPILVILVVIVLGFSYLLFLVYQQADIVTEQNKNYQGLSTLGIELNKQEGIVEHNLFIYILNQSPQALQNVDVAEIKKKNAVDDTYSQLEDDNLVNLLREYVLSEDSIYSYRQDLILAVATKNAFQIQTAYENWYQQSQKIKDNINKIAEPNKYYLNQNTFYYRQIISSFFRVTFFILLVVSILLLIFYLFIKKNVTAPIKKLANILELDAHANMNLTENILDYKRTDEIGQLNKKFFQMRERVKGYFGELEKQVAERTQELAKRVSLNEAIIGSLEDALVIIDKNGLIINTNKHFEDITGFSLREVLGKKAIDVISAFDEKAKKLNQTKEQPF